MKTAAWKKMVAIMVAAMMIFVVGCSSNNSNDGNNGNSSNAGSNSGSNSGSKSSNSNGGDKGGSEKKEEPVEMETIRVSIWERGNAPEGQKITDTVMTRWINEQMKPLGVEVEYVPLPRAEETAKLNTWMAAGSAPDVVLTYNPDTFLKYASQGGLAQLDESIEKYGQDIMKNNGDAMKAAGIFEGKRYAVMAVRPNKAGASMKIRQDWLDKVGMDMPTTLDELYEVLKAFKEQNPGGVDHVVPWSIPSLDHTIHFGPASGAGVDNAGPGTTVYSASGNIIDGKFVSHIATPEGRDYYQWMNKLYKEGLLPKEFITDVNSQQHNENITSGRVGFFEGNKGAWSWDTTMKDIEGVNWEFVPPLVAPDGEQRLPAGYPFGMFIMVPKTSEDKTDAVIKYLNWMSDPEVLVTLFNGFEGEHWKINEEIGIREAIDAEKNKQDFRWYAADLAIMSLGLKAYPSDIARKQYADRGEDFAEDVVLHRESFEKWGEGAPLLTNKRPWTEKNSGSLDALILEELSKVIIAEDFDAAYDAMMDRWRTFGGETYDQEVTAGLKEQGLIK